MLVSKTQDLHFIELKRLRKLSLKQQRCFASRDGGTKTWTNPPGPQFFKKAMATCWEINHHFRHRKCSWWREERSAFKGVVSEGCLYSILVAHAWGGQTSCGYLLPTFVPLVQAQGLQRTPDNHWQLLVAAAEQLFFNFFYFLSVRMFVKHI